MRRSLAFLGAGRWPECRISIRVVIRGEVAIQRYDSLAARSNAIIGGGMLRHISKAAREVVLNCDGSHMIAHMVVQHYGNG